MDTSPVVTGCPLRCHEPTYAVQQIARLFDCLAGIRATLWNVGATMTAYSVLMLAARITFAHFSVSSAMSLPKSAGEPTNGVPPRSASFAFILGSARPALISLLSLSTISTGVALGAPMPSHALA